MSIRPCTFLLLLCVLLTGVVVLESTGVARARDKQEEDPTALSAARRRFQEGVRYFDAGQYSKARAAFLQAYALKKHPTVLLNLAESELQAGFEADAATHFAQFLRETDGSDTAQIKQARTGLEKAKTKVAEVALTVDVDDAYVLVDGIVRGRSPLPDPLYLSAGTHVIGVRKDDQSVTRQVTAVPGESSTEMINVTSAPSGEATREAKPSEATDEAEELAEAAAEGPEEPYVGTGREPFFTWMRRSPIGLVGAGVAVLGTVTGVAFAISWQTNESAASDTSDNILAAAEQDGVEAPCTTRPTDDYKQACADYLAYKDTAENHRNISLIVGAFALLAVGGTVAAYFVTAKQGTDAAKRTEPYRRVAVAPNLDPKQPGLVVVGRF